MALTRRGKWMAAAVVAVSLIAVVVGFIALTGKGPAFIREAAAKVGLIDAPSECPLTGTPAPGDTVPNRPALAVKVENYPDARPQAGLEAADIVYEEPVEGGITRFIVLYQCDDSARVGPVRSGRTTDPDVLRQFGRAAIAYAGGVRQVRVAIEQAHLIDLNYIDADGAYERDETRVAPHNLYTSTKALYKRAKPRQPAPEAVFSYGEELELKSRKARELHLAFSANYSDVYWHWSKPEGVWVRSHGTEPHTVESGEQVSATNVLVQMVEVVPGTILDHAGNPSPEVTLTGKGKAYLFRDGRMIVGRWSRPSLRDVTTFTTKGGEEFVLKPGTTWVELFPNTIPVETSK